MRKVTRKDSEVSESCYLKYLERVAVFLRKVKIINVLLEIMYNSSTFTYNNNTLGKQS